MTHQANRRRTMLVASSLLTLSSLTWAGAPSLSQQGAELLGLPHLSGAQAALNAPFDAPIQVRVEGEKAQGETARQVNDCQTLLSLNGKITNTVSIADWGFLLRQQAACNALHALAAVRPASASQLPTSPWPQAWKALIKPALWPADVMPLLGDEANHAASPKAKRSLKQAHGTKPWRLETGKHTPEGTLVLKGSEATVHLQALARGDFNGDAQQDWLVLWSAHANGGSWEGVRAAVLSRPIGQKMITLTWLPLAH
jgi:hypothetical protein